MRIKVIDSYPGSGKTSYAIQNIRVRSLDTKIIYITPFLAEVERIIASCPERAFVQPDRGVGKGSKLTHLVSLVLQGKNIVSTHALFSNISDELIEALRQHEYVLYLDEAFQTVDKYDISTDTTNDKEADTVTRQDVDSLLVKGYIHIDEEFHVVWGDAEPILSKYQQFKRLADRQLLYYVSGSLLLWAFPIEVFREGIFSEIYVMTYMFDAQLQSYYYNYFELEYGTYHIVESDVKQGDRPCYEIVETTDRANDTAWRKAIAQKIKIVDNSKLNRIGDSYYNANNVLIDSALSENWYNKHPELLPIVKDNLANYFSNIAKVKAGLRLWTSFKADRKAIKSKNVSTKSWLALNARATNDYGDRVALAYLVNRYMNPFYENFFHRKNIVIDNDQFALSDLIQWIWRSAIRNFEDVTLYLPSVRMRNLLVEFLSTGGVW